MARGKKQFLCLEVLANSVCSDLSCPFPDSGGVQVLDGGQVGTDDLFCRPDCPLESVLVKFGGRSKPDSD